MASQPNYRIVNMDTGEVLEMDIYFERVAKSGWEKAYAKVLTSYIDVAGATSASFLAWLIKNKTPGNVILGTQREMSEKSGVSMTIVQRIIKRLKEKDLLRQVRSGTYMITPKMIRNGDNKIGAALIRQWDDCAAANETKGKKVKLAGVKNSEAA